MPPSAPGVPLPAGGIATIGHSTLSIEQFEAALRGAGIARVVDIRTIPRSRAHPQFEQQALAGALAARGLGYTYLAALGGRRGRQKAVPPAVNGLWRNQSFHNYADYALTPEFAAGLAELRARAAVERVAIMCAESLWWRCHRRIVADHLLGAGEAVRHIVGGRVEPASLTPGAVVGADGRVTYPALLA